eukprot:symbB.v1.2.029826.t1/scaffold3267.1/size78208/4
MQGDVSKACEARGEATKVAGAFRIFATHKELCLDVCWDKGFPLVSFFVNKAPCSKCFSPSSLSSLQITGSFEACAEAVEPRKAAADAKRSPGQRHAASPQSSRSTATLPKLNRRPSRTATVPPMKDLQLSLDVVGASCSLGLHARRWSRSNVAPLRRPSAGSAAPAWQEDSEDMSQKRVPLTTWLQEMGVDVDMSDLLVQGRSAMNHQKRQPMSHAQRARLDRAFVEQLDRIAWERGLPLEDLTQDLQIFRLKLHDRQARRRLHDIFGAKRRKAPPPPEFAKVVPVQTADVPKVKEQQQPWRIPPLCQRRLVRRLVGFEPHRNQLHRKWMNRWCRLNLPRFIQKKRSRLRSTFGLNQKLQPFHRRQRFHQR